MAFGHFFFQEDMCVALCSGPGLFFAWPEIGTFQKKLQRCSMAWIQWFLALRLQAPEFSILSVARRTYFFLTQNYQLMISGYDASRARLLYSEQGPRTYIFLIRDLFKLVMSSDSEASRARFLYSERGSQDIRFPFTNSIRIGDFWLWGFEGQIFLLPAWPSGHTFSLYKAYLNLSFLTLRLQGPDLCILNVAPRMYNFLVQSLSKLVISDSGTSRTRFLYSERG